jgi:hypothetical protein
MPMLEHIGSVFPLEMVGQIVLVSALLRLSVTEIHVRSYRID